jgi:hypothetical protein
MHPGLMMAAKEFSLASAEKPVGTEILSRPVQKINQHRRDASY